MSKEEQDSAITSQKKRLSKIKAYEEYKVIVEPNKVCWYHETENFLVVHRLDGPAIEYDDGTEGYKLWYVNGRRHRLDGPAVEQSNGDKEWWIEGVQYTKEEFDERIKTLAQ